MIDTKETPVVNAADATAQWKEPMNTHALHILKTFLTEEDIISAHTGICCPLLPINTEVI